MIMRMGIFLRNFGPYSTADNIAACAKAAESMGLDDVWLSDHIAIPPEEAEGSGGRYLDPLATLAYIAGITDRIGIGTSVLIVPYRPALVTAKWIATIQELSNGRLSIGAAVGWMKGEFRAAGVDHKRRGAITDETLALWHELFANDEAELNDQRFVFKPRPPRPKFLIGGAAPHAINRAVNLADGWMPAEGDPEKLRNPVAELTERMMQFGKSKPEVIPLTNLPLDDPKQAASKLATLAEVGVTGIIHAGKYEKKAEFVAILEKLLRAKNDAGLN
jgi:probable F420-dependent oxidoreductase